ncbi:hypothetical protein X738_23135 [Mesorhizobium sp. LNHC209A00]|nr:hypothetical protein X738_23135 [Mesorhizobium sp. LNHC209A00]
MAGKVADEFIELLEATGVDLKAHSQTEGDALAMMQVLEIWRGRAAMPKDPRAVIRAALGFVDLAGKLLAVKGHSDFDQLRPHLMNLASGSVLQNRFAPVTDAVSNKMAELYIASLVMSFASNVVVDHPDRSKGDNPDVMFTFRGRPWAIAVKTLASKRNARSIYDNIKYGSDQIQVSDADFGLIVINLKNVLDHDALWPQLDGPIEEEMARNELNSQISEIVSSLSEIPESDWALAFGPDRKAEPPILFLAQGVSFVVRSTDGGRYLMPMKFFSTYLDAKKDSHGGVKLAHTLNDAMQSLI